MENILFSVIQVVLSIIAYVVMALALSVIAKREGHKYPWLAWIPGANLALLFQLGSFNWALVFLLFVPILGWIAIFVLEIISLWRIFEKEKYPGALALLTFVPGAILIVLAIVAWAKKN